MMANVHKNGKSFKGCNAYLSHDKSEDQNEFNQAAGVKPTTSDRVEWTATRNLSTDDPETASRIMAATAMNGQALKLARGIKTGQKAKVPVMHYSLGWHPDEKGKFDKDKMLEAVEGSLKAIGAEDYQAVIYCHNDTKHPHLHVMINRVHPETGIMLNDSNSVRKLDRWAYEYRRDRDELHYTPQRAKKFEAFEQGQKHEQTKFDKTAKHRSDNDNKALNSPTDEARVLKGYEKKANQKLVIRGEKMAEKHRQEWKDLSHSHKARKDKIYADHKKKMRKHFDALWKSYAPERKKAGRENWRLMKGYEYQERSLSGIVMNSITAAIIHRRLNKSENGFVKDAAIMFIDSKKRRDAHKQQTDKRFDIVRQAHKEQKGRDYSNLRDARLQALVENRQRFTAERSALIEKQNQEQKELRLAWRERKAESRKHLKDLRAVQDAKQAQKQNAVHKTKEQNDFSHAAANVQSDAELKATEKFVREAFGDEWDNLDQKHKALIHSMKSNRPNDVKAMKSLIGRLREERKALKSRHEKILSGEIKPEKAEQEKAEKSQNRKRSRSRKRSYGFKHKPK